MGDRGIAAVVVAAVENMCSSFAIIRPVHRNADVSPHFLKEQKLAQAFMKGNIFVQRRLTKEELKDKLQNNLIIPMVDPGQLYQTSSVGAHFVVLFAAENTNIWFHDPVCRRTDQ